MAGRGGKPLSAREAAINFLSRREHGRRELAHKLAQKGFGPEETAAVLDALQAENLLSEARFAESLIHARISRGQGPERIRRELQQHDLDPELIAACLEESETPWLELAREVHRKRFGGKLPGERREWAKQAQFLAYRGFTREQIKKVLRDDPDEF